MYNEFLENLLMLALFAMLMFWTVVTVIVFGFVIKFKHWLTRALTLVFTVKLFSGKKRR